MAVFHAAATPVHPPSTLAWHFCFLAGQVVWPRVDGLCPRPDAALAGLPADRHYLGRLDGLDCWALALDALPEGWQPQGLRVAMQGTVAELAALLARAAQVLEWARAHRFCGACGTPTERKPAEFCLACPACGQLAYPRLSPAMMVLVWREGQLLLARSPGFAPGIYSALAGFVEPGESLEDCVHREVAEEVGVRIGTLRYFGSQSWPFPHSLMLAFSAPWQGGVIVPQAGEIEDARWFDLDALPAIPPPLSIAGRLIAEVTATLRAGRQP